MPQSHANRRQTDATVDEFSCVGMPELVKRTDYPCLRAVVVPAFLHRLVAQWSSSPVLLRSEQRPIFVAHPFQVGPELLYQVRIVEQDRPSLATFSHDGQVLIVEREVDILHIQRQSLADPQARFQDQAEDESITLTADRNSFATTFTLCT